MGPAGPQGARQMHDNTQADQRRYPRITAHPEYPEELYLFNESRGTVSGKIVNLSVRGVGFLLDGHIGLNETFTVALVLHEPKDVVLCNGLIRFRRNFWHQAGCGMELFPHPGDEEKLSRYISARSGPTPLGSATLAGAEPLA